MRGPCWEPYFTWTEDGRDWAPPRRSCTRPRPPADSAAAAAASGRTRSTPGAPGESVLIALSDGHPASFKTASTSSGSRATPSTARTAAGSARSPTCRCASPSSTASTPTRPGAAARGRWTSAVGADGAPVIVYTTLKGREDTFRYARYDGRALAQRTRSPAPGGTLFSYHNSGVSLDHADPARLVLSRSVGAQNEVEVFRTPIAGGRGGSPRSPRPRRASTSARSSRAATGATTGTR